MEDLTPEELFEQHLQYLPYLIRRYQNLREYEDIKQHAMIGFFRAAERFDVNKGVLFTTYAKYYVKQEIIRNYFEKRPQLKTSRLILEKAVKVRRFIGDTKDPEELAKLTGLSVKEVDEVLDYLDFNSRIASFQYTMPGSGDEEVNTLADVIPDKNDNWEYSIHLNEFVETLTELEQTVLHLLLNDLTQPEIAEVLNTYQMKISRIQKGIRAKYNEFNKEVN